MINDVAALLAAQIAAEDAVLAQGLEVWSVADPATGEVVLHVSKPSGFPDVARYVFAKRDGLMKRLAKA